MNIIFTSTSFSSVRSSDTLTVHTKKLHKETGTTTSDVELFLFLNVLMSEIEGRHPLLREQKQHVQGRVIRSKSKTMV